MLHYDPGMQIVFPEIHWQELIEHCRRKLTGEYLNRETPEKKAYGMIAGTLSEKIMEVGGCFPLRKNVRTQQPYKDSIDLLMQRHAVRSVTSLDKRGWVADPDEWEAVLEKCRNNNLILLGTYHMHRVAWDHDQERDTPTKLDGILGNKSRMFMFIVSMVKPEKPIVRAFYEGDISREAEVIRR